MTDNDVGRIISALQGAYHQSGPEGARAVEQTVSVWRNVLLPLEADLALRAANVWISTQKFWPTPAEFIGTIDSLRRNDRQSGREDQIIAATRCDGTGWMDRGNGMEPCPACNPWLRSLYQEGELGRMVQPDSGYVMPSPCRRIHLDDQPGATWATAMDAMTRGYREQLVEYGYTDEQIEEKTIRKASKFMAFAKRIEAPAAEVVDADL